MFLVRVTLAPSRIHGLGVMAAEPIRAGTVLWRFAPGIDLVLDKATLGDLPDAFRAYLDRYSYEPPHMPGRIVLSCDEAKYLNHSAEPNTLLRGDETLARSDIATGEEITCDYRAVVSGWSGFG